MSLSLFDDREIDSLGGAEKKSNPIPEGTEWVVGRVYAEWCGHCVGMKKDWGDLKEYIHTEKGGKIAVKDIEDVVMEKELSTLNRAHFHHHAGIQSAGFPTIFMYKIGNANKTLEYYKGERSYGAMKQWVDSKLSTAAMHKRKTGRMKKGGSSRKKKNQRRKKTTRRTM